MRFEWIAWNVDACFNCGDPVIDNHPHGHFTKAHSEHFEETDRSIGEASAQPEIKESKNQDEKNEDEERDDCANDKVERFHGGTLTKRVEWEKSNCVPVVHGNEVRGQSYVNHVCDHGISVSKDEQ